jgi:hypothetical protein
MMTEAEITIEQEEQERDRYFNYIQMICGGEMKSLDKLATEDMKIIYDTIGNLCCDLDDMQRES